jgi:hypothetical protein
MCSFDAELDASLAALNRSVDGHMWT